MKTLTHLFERNKTWASSIKQEEPDFFLKLSKGQHPEYLWIGCSDSRVPANQIMDLPPGEVFVHRNIANLVLEEDTNCLSVIQYAVEMLKVKHIIICGHYGCGGIKAAMEGQKLGLIDNWLKHIKATNQFEEDQFEGLSDDETYDKLCELNVNEQVKNVSNTSFVQDAWKNKADLTIHGWIYDLDNGILKDLEININSPEQLNNLR